MSDHVRVDGRVTSGRGFAGPATSLAWFRASVRELWGFEPVAGTLNVIVEGDWRQVDRLLLPAGTLLVPPSLDVCCSLMVPARIGRAGREVPVVLFRPLIHGYNPAQLEFLAPVRLRDALELQDGDLVTATLQDAPPVRKWFAAAAADGIQPE